MERAAPAGVLIFALTITWGAFDIIMALDPVWYSTIFGVYFFFKFELPFFYCSIVIFIGILSNVYLQFKFKKKQLNNLNYINYFN